MVKSLLLFLCEEKKLNLYTILISCCGMLYEQKINRMREVMNILFIVVIIILSLYGLYLFKLLLMEEHE